jgi:PncC family amidohydrolase
MEEVVKRLIELNKTISTMESCTGGSIVNSITNVEGASDVLKFSAVTYSNEYKIKMGVDESIINTYTVYSMEVAREMSKVISNFTNSNIGIGVTGKLNRVDKANLVGEDNIIFISIYDRDNDKYTEFTLSAIYSDRESNKNYIVSEISKKLLTIL